MVLELVVWERLAFGDGGGVRERGYVLRYAIVRALGVVDVVINRVYQYPILSYHLRDRILS